MSDWVVITGGGGGIGAALSLQMSRSGYRVLAVDMDFQCLDKSLDDGKCEGDVITKLTGDVSSEETLNQIVASIPQSDKILFLVQCAAAFNIGKIQDVTRNKLEQSLSVNVLAPFLIAQALLPRLTSSKGRILFIDTLVDHYPVVGSMCYGVTKAAHHKLGQQFKLELADSPVKVGSAYPGLVKTEGFYSCLDAKKKAGIFTEKGESFTAEMDKKRCFLEPEESAKFLKYLLLETSEEDFMKVNWRADDTDHWGHWR